ncbi:Intracellular serine protease [compost metagenome]
MRLNVFSIILSLLVATAAQADQRVLVIMKDKASFKTAHAAYQMQSAYPLKAGSSVQVKGQVTDSLHNLNTLVVTVQNDAEMAKIKAIPGVVYVEKEVFHEAPRPHAGALSVKAAQTRFKKATIGKDTPWGIMAVKAPAAWNKAARGAGARVLVLDTGIDANHPSLKDNFEKGQDFTGASTGEDYNDENGHGTHVAGTIAGELDNTGFTGVAPLARVLAGRVCSSQGCSNIAIAQGVNWGIQENVDVISMSLGGMWSTPAERDAIAKADAAGITVVAASGNSGTPRVSYPAALPTVIAVGAIDIDLKKADFSQWGPELAIVAPGVAVISSVPMGTGRESSVSITVGQTTAAVKSSTFQGAKEVLSPESNELVAAGLGKVEDFAKANVTGKYALISRGEIAFADKAANAIKAGAAGVVIYNNAPGLIQGALTQDGSVLPVPVFMIEQTVGNEILKSLAAGTVVKATLQTVATNYSAFDGTSMATPHVSGVVALMKAANKKLTPAQVKAIIQSTATALGPNTANEYGAGLIDAEKAVNAAISAK